MVLKKRNDISQLEWNRGPFASMFIDAKGFLFVILSKVMKLNMEILFLQ